jgi:hypothetical protein
MKRDRAQLQHDVAYMVARLRALAADVRETAPEVKAADLYTAASLVENVADALAEGICTCNAGDLPLFDHKPFCGLRREPAEVTA